MVYPRSSEGVWESHDCEEGNGHHEGIGRGGAFNVGEDIDGGHSDAATAVGSLGSSAGAYLSLANAERVEVSTIGNALSGCCGSISVLVAVELGVAKGTVGWAAKALSLVAICIDSAPWKGGTVASAVLGWNSSE